ncbi:uncharacterized protein A1O5_05565 [Cladophialophora psammophila CBS 110553]|uniref:NACHT domain-containing protein n=1 Tax=Cladophialophora psammophila CBS 110553 TaxID=1182543 RepID=W9X362_9EURO|nr:uncharacterized protein A1O5_05565 [Cladophialophora psammophila CBS 110553]EXJ71755.1 hypothetical protein A1O5_05565 [Cladophialophora psammophila CBS 110553]
MAASQSPGSIMRHAFHRLKDSVTPADSLLFQKTELKDVWDAAEEIQKSQRQRKSLQALSRIKPLLDNLQRYSRVIEVLCNGTPYLPWIWLASNYSNIFDKLLDGYSQIASSMPHFDRLQSACSDDENFMVIMALVYSDILEFHQRAYKFFRRKAWHIIFDSSWKSFEGRFGGILANLSKHKDMLMKEAIAIDIVEARKWRAHAAEELDKNEKERDQVYINDTLAWLNVQQGNQDDELYRLLARRQSGTCDWIFKHPKFISWKDDAHADRVLWVNGIPGAGKTILCSYIIDTLQRESTRTIAYIICNSYTQGKDIVSGNLRGLAAQLLRANRDLVPYAFDTFANKALPPSVTHVKRLISDLLDMIQETFIFIDGLDEYSMPQQRSMLNEILSFAKVTGGKCKITISSRDVPAIASKMKNRPLISLRDEHSGVEEDIQNFLSEALQELSARFEGKERDMKDILDLVTLKADGMFLWVRLILEELYRCYSLAELRKTAEELPKGIEEAYGRFLQRVTKEMDHKEYVKVIRILEWLACSCRLMKMREVQDGIVFHADNMVLDDETKLSPAVMNLCKPLIEEGPNKTVDFVHYSAKEFILDKVSGPLLQESQAHYNIAFSCITYLNTAIYFLAPGPFEDLAKVRVAKGFHGLHNYANEYWFQHILQCARDLINLDSSGIMVSALRTLQERYWKGKPGHAAQSLKLDDTTTANEICKELAVLGDLDHVRQMGTDVQTFRAHLVQERHAHKVAEKHHAYELEHDPTLFSQISHRYQEVVLFLLTCKLDGVPPRIDQETLATFRKEYGESEFTCRFHECPFHSDGFHTIQARNNHELGHFKKLRCADPTCEFFARGFASRTGLLKHNRKYHPSPDEVQLPEFVPIRPQTPPPPPPAPPPLPAPNVSPAPSPTPPSVEPPPSPILESAPVKKVRQKRGKRGLPVHNCEFCGKVFMRAEALRYVYPSVDVFYKNSHRMSSRRHQLNHVPPGFRCPHEHCSREFHREDLYERHLNKQ